jgi:carboxyl-terminal processing protease
MVDELSASAAEIFAAAIQDYKRGIIIGSSSTYGKGTVQRNISVNPENDNPLFANKKTEDLGSVKLTIQKFYRINGGATQLKGVTPDIILPDRFEYLKFREKDNPSALPWDTIAKSSYKPWTSTVSSPLVVNKINEELKKNTTFSKIKTVIEWLNKYSDKEYSLNIDTYREEQKQLRATYKDLNELTSQNQVIKVNNLAIDTNAINAAKEKVEKNNRWLKRISNDIYIEESVKVINSMITQSGAAKNK